jgi:hypothetical protein
MLTHTSAFFSYAYMQVLEIRPSIKWDKGKALEFLLKSLGRSLSLSLSANQINYMRTHIYGAHVYILVFLTI